MNAAVEVIAAQGPMALSLRDLARRAGVSHAAPAHHFGDRTGLLTAIAIEGYRLLAEELTGAPELRELGVRYVRFALKHPAHFSVMFDARLIRADDPELTAARARTYRPLRDAVAAVPTERRGEDTTLAGVAAWSLAHGMATLWTTGALRARLNADDPEQVFRSLAAILFPPIG